MNMMNSKSTAIEEISRFVGQIAHLDIGGLPPVFPVEVKIPSLKPLSDEARQKYESSLDDTIALSIPRPSSKEEEQKLIKRFLAGLEKLFSREGNWPFLQPLTLSIEACAKCQTCSDACHIYWASGGHGLYEPLYRAEILRRLYFHYIKPGGRFFKKWRYGAIDLNWTTIARLAELSYRCNLCRRCAQTCPLSLDNGLITHELRKLFSQEMGIAPRELHDDGSVLQLKTGSTTGMSPHIIKDNVDFIDDDISERTGIPIKTSWDKKGADVLLIHNAGEILAWPENHGAFATLLTLAGIDWTLSSEAEEAIGYDAVNYGLWYDDAMLAKVSLRQAKAAKMLGVKRIVIGECGHAHKALSVVADRILMGELNIPRESSIPLIESIVFSGRLKFDPSRNRFPVTLHDPCNMVRLMGIVEPQRRVLRALCPEFREMEPHGVDNYCCGGGSGFAIMSGHNFQDFRMHVTGRKKLEQILKAFEDKPEPSIHKYVCTPCSNCKGQIRDLIRTFDLWNQYGVNYGGLVEVVVNALDVVKPGYIQWEMH